MDKFLNKIICGDSLEVLKEMPDESIDCCITSPPYWGLRDYGMIEQFGLEKTPEEYVENLVKVFREVRRVLKREGVMFLNLGDSYAAGGNGGGTMKQDSNRGTLALKGKVKKAPLGLKPKDLVGIPWRVAFALQQLYYTGKIKDEKDRVWLAAMIDGEGCMFIHKRKAGQNNGQGYQRKHDSYSSALEVANTSLAIIERCQKITGLGSVSSHTKDRQQKLYRWNLRSNECRDVITEIYPHLVGKQHQARLLIGCPSSGEDAAKAHQSLMNLHNGLKAEIDFPEPKSMFEPGFYLRQDIIWKKPNPMPESVTDRCTKSHEYIFLLAKSQKYYFDNEAIREPNANPERTNYIPGSRINGENKDRNDNDFAARERKKLRPYGVVRNRTLAYNSKENVMRGMPEATVENENELPHPSNGRNKRSVWTITTKPFKGAHFATFPEDLIVPMIKAGCPQFVCNKCGKARETILDITRQYTPVESKTEKGKLREQGIGPYKRANSKENGGFPSPISKIIGLTNCDCNAGFSNGIILDPFMGSGTTALVAKKLRRNYVGIELNESYIAIANKRLASYNPPAIL